MLNIKVEEKFIRLQFYAHKSHEGDTHQTSDNKRDAHALQAFGDLGIAQFFADGGNGHDSQQPAYARTETEHCRLAYIAGGALLHKERATQDGAIHRD